MCNERRGIYKYSVHAYRYEFICIMSRTKKKKNEERTAAERTPHTRRDTIKCKTGEKRARELWIHIVIMIIVLLNGRAMAVSTIIITKKKNNIILYII